MRTSSAAALVLASGFLVSCGFGSNACPPAPDVCPAPATVQKVLDDKCGQCHSVPPQNGAPAGFRLDRLDGANGAQSVADNVIVQIDSGAMPREGSLTDGERETLHDWQACLCAQRSVP